MIHTAIRRFVDSIRQQSRGQSRTFNMPMDQAQDLANELALVLIRENELLREISELKSANSVTEIVLGGGSF